MMKQPYELQGQQREAAGEGGKVEFGNLAEIADEAAPVDCLPRELVGSWGGIDGFSSSPFACMGMIQKLAEHKSAWNLSYIFKL